ncbi:mitohcondrial RNA polymerase [Scheffersomyces xylosifermentans]|uniref:mitohcondrial RNA polymerase n=1 Tax=Scheffersomyces xylosifermentans TaxID=1304137 RepID=UPI00315DDD28
MTSRVIARYELDTELKLEEKERRSPNLQTTILINNFFQSVIHNDFNRSRFLLEKLAGKVNSTDLTASLNHQNNYYSCFLLLLTNINSRKEETLIYNVKTLVEAFELFEKSITKNRKISTQMKQSRKDIRVKLVISIINCLKDKKSSSKIYTKSIADYTFKVMSLFKLDPIQIGNEIANIETYEKFLTICKSSGFKLDTKSISWKGYNQIESIQMSQVSTSIDTYKDSNGFINLENLCKYIEETRFEEYDTDTQNSKKLFEIYDGLGDVEKNNFMSKYLEFNRPREMNVEANCLDLVENFDSIHTQNNSKISKKKELMSVGRFRSNHSKILYNWFEANVNHITALTKKLNNVSDPDELNEDEALLLKYITHLNLIPTRALVTLIVSNLLSMTISSKEGHLRLVTIASTLSNSFSRILMKDKSFIAVKKQLLEIFDHELDGVRLFSALIKICLQNCRMTIPQDHLEEFQNSLALMDIELPKEFMQDSNGECRAFLYSLIPFEGKKVVGIIQAHPYMYQQFKIYNTLSFNKTLFLPMLYPPKPWTSPTNGGYLLDLKPIVTTVDLQTSMAYLNKAHSTGQLNSTYDGLNYLSGNAWAINPKVFEVFHKVMQFENGFLKIPPHLETLRVQDVEDYDDLKTRRILYNLVHILAKTFNANGDIFFLPHNVDFRGRAYPMVSILTHYQEDLVRGLLMFWHSKPLGKKGFDWLKYHLAGVFGKDKLSHPERLQFVDDNMTSILESAKDPFGGDMWWKHGEKPWQTLALCIEINNVLNHVKNGGAVEEFLCRIAIHQDGSCNGLQHYAALGADKEGGRAVNLLPTETNGIIQRGDVYTKVLEIVKTKVEKDIEEKRPSSEVASVALSILNRKLIKQTVMTTVYGVTTYGGASQIYLKIKDIIQDYEIQINNKESVDLRQLQSLKKYRRLLSMYLARIVLGSISELFSGAQIIQDWLVDNCFRCINSFDLDTMKFIKKNNSGKIPSFTSHASYRPMMWTSLSGYPVVQLYKNSKSSIISTAMQSISINRPQELAPINKKKQMNAIAPNFIHSIDSIHMLMTCVASKRRNIPFVSVHDSFWTYPCHVDELSRLLREEFIRLHSSHIIESLREDLLYTTSNSFQLVWFKSDENPQLMNELTKIRESYDLSSLGEGTKQDRILYHELIVLSDHKTSVSKSQLSSLIENYKPTLYLRTRHSSNVVERYDSSLNKGLSIKFDRKSFTPVLVPVSVLDCPPTGELDLNEVLQSRYFFS